MSKQYGRRWELKIDKKDGSMALTIAQDGFTPESLKVEFDINYPGYQTWLISTIVIWNLDENTISTLITAPVEGATVKFQAGYTGKGNKYGLIFSGYVLQSLFQRINVTDYRLELRCVAGQRVFNNNWINTSLQKNLTAMSLFNAGIGKANYPVNADYLSNTIKAQTATTRRGVCIFKSTKDYISEFAQDTASQPQIIDGALKMMTQADGAETKAMAIEKTPDNGLIGTPVQVDYGASFRCLLDPDIKLQVPPLWVKLTGAMVNLQSVTPGVIASKLDSDMFLKVGSVRHVGNTRGEEWYTEVVGYSMAGKIPFDLYISPNADSVLIDPNNTTTPGATGKG